MEGIALAPGSPLAEYVTAHPETAICRVSGTWHAWVPDGHGGGGAAHADSAEELLAKLAAGPGG